jgi:hypothetical protein
MRPVSFLAQAASQRAQASENAKTRDFQKDQALRDFGMNIGQSLVASLGNFGAQAGAQAIAFNREEPYKQLEANVNPMPGLVPKIGAVPSALKTPTPTAPPSAALEQAALARTATTPPAAELPGRQAPARPPLPAPAAMAGALGGAVSKAIAPRPPVPGTIASGVGKAGPPPARDEIASAFDAPGQPPAPPARVAPPMRRPAPTMPPRGAEVASPRSGREMEIAAAPPPAAPMSVMGALKQAGRGLTAPAAPPSAPPPPARGSVIESVLRSSSGSVNPEAQSWAQQEMRQIIQKHLGPPMEYTNADGSPADPQDAAFRRAYDQKADNARLDMLVKMGLVDANDMKAEAYRIRNLMQGEAAATKASAYETEKRSAATKNYADASKSLSPVFNKYGTSDAPGALNVVKPLGGAPDAYMGPDAPLQRRGGGSGGGAPRVSVQFPDATEVWAQGYSETKNDRGQNLQEAVVVPEEYLALADKKLKKYRYIERADAPAIEKALKAGDWERAQVFFKFANARYAKGYAAQTEAVTPPTVVAGRMDAATNEAGREADALLGNNVERDKAVADAKARLLAARQPLSPKDVGLTVRSASNRGFNIDKETNVDDLDAATALRVALEGGTVPEGEGAKVVYDTAKRVLERRRKEAMDAIAPFRSSYIKGGGTAEEFDGTVLPQPKAAPGTLNLDPLAPGPSTPSPGQFSPPPGKQSSLDNLFDQIEAKPWDAAKKRRVFRDMAQKAGLA